MEIWHSVCGRKFDVMVLQLKKSSNFNCLLVNKVGPKQNFTKVTRSDFASNVRVMVITPRLAPPHLGTGSWEYIKHV